MRKTVKDHHERPFSLIGVAGAFSVASITRTFLGMAGLAAENSTGFCKNCWEKIMETLISNRWFHCPRAVRISDGRDDSSGEILTNPFMQTSSWLIASTGRFAQSKENQYL